MNPSGEMYLESIYVLHNEKGAVRSIDIAEYMNFSKPSVSIAMKNLREKKYIDVDDNGYITLTDAGLKQAEIVLEKHTILSNWLIGLGVNPETALEDACRMEHDISEESYAAIKAFISKNTSE